MFIAHLPASYLVTRPLQRRAGVHAGRWLCLGLFAGVAPDLDLIRFYLLDHRAFDHHRYWSHLPGVWAGVALVGWALAAWVRSPTLRFAVLVCFVNVELHLLLDTVAGGIAWGYPLSAHRFALFAVQPGHHPWFLNFFLHWTFALELAITATALVVARGHHSSAARMRSAMR